MQILLAAGADPSAQDSQNGRTALHTAAMTNDVDLVQVCESSSCLKQQCIHKYFECANMFCLL